MNKLRNSFVYKNKNKIISILPHIIALDFTFLRIGTLTGLDMAILIYVPFISSATSGRFLYQYISTVKLEFDLKKIATQTLFTVS